MSNEYRIKRKERRRDRRDAYTRVRLSAKLRKGKEDIPKKTDVKGKLGRTYEGKALSGFLN